MSSFGAGLDWEGAPGLRLAAHIKPPTGLPSCNFSTSSQHTHFHFLSAHHQPSTINQKPSRLKHNHFHLIQKFIDIMSNNTKNIEKPNLSERDMELLACAMRCVEGGFPKASLNGPLFIQLPTSSPSTLLHWALVLSNFLCCKSRSIEPTRVLHPSCCAVPDRHRACATELSRSRLTFLTNKIDFKKFAEMAGFKNPHSASVSFNSVKKKIMGEAFGAKPTPKKSTPSKRKQADAAAADSDDADETPSKKVKVSSKKPVKKEEKVKEEFDDDEGAAFL